MEALVELHGRGSTVSKLWSWAIWASTFLAFVAP